MTHPHDGPHPGRGHERHGHDDDDQAEALDLEAEVLAEHLAAADLAALDRLLDPDAPHGILRRDDLAVRTVRTVRAARHGA